MKYRPCVKFVRHVVVLQIDFVWREQSQFRICATEFRCQLKWLAFNSVSHGLFKVYKNLCVQVSEFFPSLKCNSHSTLAVVA